MFLTMGQMERVGKVLETGRVPCCAAKGRDAADSLSQVAAEPSHDGTRMG